MGSISGFKNRLCQAKATPMEAADSRLGAPLNRRIALAAPVRRNGQAGSLIVAVWRRGAPGGCPRLAALPQTGPALMPITLT